MTLKQTLCRAREVLTAGSVDDTSLECELLLRHVLGVSRVQLYLDLDRKLSLEQDKAFWNLVERRLRYEPSAYLVGHREFYDLDFFVSPGVLIPRPESELLVEKSLNIDQNYPVVTIAEVGTGCGAIAINLALNLPQVKIYAIDISTAALEIALFNCERYRVLDRISLLCGSMLEPVPEPVDLIVANLPYVKESDLPQVPSMRFEPQIALDGGVDGLEKIRQLSLQVSAKLRPGGSLLLEIGQGQGEAVITFLQGLFPSTSIEVTPDLGGIERVISLTIAN